MMASYKPLVQSSGYPSENTSPPSPPADELPSYQSTVQGTRPWSEQRELHLLLFALVLLGMLWVSIKGS